MIVDDVNDQRLIAHTALKRLGYNPCSVGSGEAAVAYLKEKKVDVVLLDMIMDPGIDGLETFKQIRQISKDQKAVIASGFSKTEKVKAAMALGAGTYIKKPYTIEKIASAIRQVLDA